MKIYTMNVSKDSSCMKIEISPSERISTLVFSRNLPSLLPISFNSLFLTESFSNEASFFRGVHIRRPHFNHSHFSTVSTVYSCFFSCFYPLLTLNLISSHIQTLEAIYEYPYLFAPEYILHI